MTTNKEVLNAAGRSVPVKLNGEPVIPYKGLGKHRPTGNKFGPRIVSCADYPADGNKIVPTLKDALIRSGIRDGMTISTHHHFRNGDLIANMIFDIIHELGIKNLRWFPSASFPCHEHLIPYLEDGTIHHIEGSMNGPLGRFTSQGKMKGVGVLRSHGGRYQAIQDGEVKIDIAVIGAGCADPFGNANGLFGPSASGLLGFALADAQYAEKVIVVTDNLVDFPCVPWQIHGNMLITPLLLIKQAIRIKLFLEQLVLLTVLTGFYSLTLQDDFVKQQESFVMAFLFKPVPAAHLWLSVNIFARS